MPSRSELGRVLRLRVGQARLAAHVWRTYLRVRLGLRRMPLPRLAESLAPAHGATVRLHPYLLSRAVHRSLGLGVLRPRCLTSSLVLYTLLRAQGDEAVVVIGLPADARDHAAHAWVELDGDDIGPPPGRGRHVEIARYPLAGRADTP